MQTSHASRLAHGSRRRLPPAPNLPHLPIRPFRRFGLSRIITGCRLRFGTLPHRASINSRQVNYCAKEVAAGIGTQRIFKSRRMFLINIKTQYDKSPTQAAMMQPSVHRPLITFSAGGHAKNPGKPKELSVSPGLYGCALRVKRWA